MWSPSLSVCVYVRALGDTVGSSAGVIAEPEITCTEQITHTHRRTRPFAQSMSCHVWCGCVQSVYNLDPSKDQFIIMCSDGVWEFISSQEAVDMVATRPIKKVQEAAETLAGESWKRCACETTQHTYLSHVYLI